MPQLGTVAPSYARAATALRSIAYESAQRTFGLSSGAVAFWTIIARGHGSSQAYGAAAFQALTFGLACATVRNEPNERMPMLGVSSSFCLRASATLVSVPRYVKLTVCGAGVTPNTCVPQ